MKRLLLLPTLLMLLAQGMSQSVVVISDTVTFDSLMPSYIILDTTQANNVWQVGAPSKLNFNSAWSAPNALMTDTLLPFLPGNTSSFTIQLFSDTTSWMCIGEGWISFRHAYDFDSLLAGGYIEIRYHDFFQGIWTPWVNVAQDSLPMFAYLNQLPIPKDTILGGIPAYTGKSYGWKNAEYYWFWMALVKWGVFMNHLELRFTATSDSSASATEGWMIDDLSIILTECAGSVDDVETGRFISRAVPNPGSGDIRIELNTSVTEPLQLHIFNSDGRVMERQEIGQGEEVVIRCSAYPSGHYLYRLVSASGMVSEGKFIKL